MFGDEFDVPRGQVDSYRGCGFCLEAGIGMSSTYGVWVNDLTREVIQSSKVQKDKEEVAPGHSPSWL
jgi:hypothetical protein